MNCAKYTEKGWCADGKAVAGSEWTLGAKYQFPEENCCACGKAVPAAEAITAAGAPACVDDEAFDNGHGMNCAKYTEKGWCAGGEVVAGSEWTLGAKYKFPEENCCVCGKPVLEVLNATAA